MALACSDFGNTIFVAICDKTVAEPYQVVGATIASLIFVLITPVRHWFVRQFWNAISFLSSGWVASRRLTAARESVAQNGVGPWISLPPCPPPNYKLRMESAAG